LLTCLPSIRLLHSFASPQVLSSANGFFCRNTCTSVSKGDNPNCLIQCLCFVFRSITDKPIVRNLRIVLDKILNNIIWCISQTLLTHMNIYIKFKLKQFPFISLIILKYNNCLNWSCEDVCDIHCFLLNNCLIKFGNDIYINKLQVYPWKLIMHLWWLIFFYFVMRVNLCIPLKIK